MMPELERRIAVTGMGMIGPFGIGVEALWQSLESGGVPFQPCSRYVTNLPSAEAHVPDLRRLLRTVSVARAPMLSQFALVAVHFALAEADLKPGVQIPGEQIALVYGTSNGPGAATQELYDDLLAAGPAAVKPRVFQESVFNAPASLASIQFGIKGPIIVSPSGAAAGAHVLLQAQILLAQDDVTAVIVLCADELCEGLQTAAHMVRYHCGPLTDSYGAQPFDQRGSGPVMSEGACALILERVDRAVARGAIALAELAGVACTSDAYRLAHNAPDGRGLSAAIHACLQDAEAVATDVGAVISGAGCTRADEVVEQAALHSVFGSAPPPISSTKGGIGLSMGAAALFDAALSIETLRRRILPPTPRHDVPAKGLSLDVVKHARPAPDLKAVLSNSISVNGLYGAVLFRRGDS